METALSIVKVSVGNSTVTGVAEFAAVSCATVSAFLLQEIIKTENRNNVTIFRIFIKVILCFRIDFLILKVEFYRSKVRFLRLCNW